VSKSRFNMHLGWFGETAPEPEEPDDDLTFAEGADDDDNVEVVVGEVEEPAPEPEESPVADPEFAGKSKEDLIEIVRQSRGKPDQTDALLQGFDKISNTLARAQARPPDERDPAEVLREKLIDEPDKALDYYFTKKIQPDVQRLLAGNLTNSRKFAKLNPETSWVMKDYAEEVESEVQKMPPAYQLQNTDVYEEACNRVKLKHVDAIIERQVAERLQKATPATVAKPSGGTYTEVPSGRPAPTKRVIRITTDQEQEERQMAATYGISWDNWIKTTKFQKKYGGGAR
jgi:hypothetical protein